MKVKMMFYVVSVVLLPVICAAQHTADVSIQGTVGDFSALSRDYEIDGKIYDFPNTIILVDTAGTRLPFDRIKPGALIKVIGDKIIGGAQSDAVEWKKIILIRQ